MLPFQHGYPALDAIPQVDKSDSNHKRQRRVNAHVTVHLNHVGSIATKQYDQALDSLSHHDYGLAEYKKADAQRSV